MRSVYLFSAAMLWTLGGASCGNGNEDGFADTFSVHDSVTSAQTSENDGVDPSTQEDGFYLYVVSTGVSSAYLELNDARIFGPSHFKNKDFESTRSIELVEENSIAVSLRGSPGDQLCVRVYEIDSADTDEPERTIYERCVDREAGPPNVVNDSF